MTGRRRIALLALACACVLVAVVLAIRQPTQDATCPIGHVVDYRESGDGTATIERGDRHFLPIPGTYLYRSDRLRVELRERASPRKGDAVPSKPLARIAYYVFARDGTPTYGQLIREETGHEEVALDETYADCTDPSFLRRGLRRDWLLTGHFLPFRGPSNAAADVTASRTK